MKENLGYTTKMGIQVSDEMVRATMIPKEYFGAKTEKCTTYTPTTDTSDRCLICGELKYEHKNQ